MQKINGYLITLVILLVTLILGACQSATPEPSPIEVLEALEAAHNAQDVDAAVALFAEDGVEINAVGVWKGSDKIRLIYGNLVDTAQIDNTNFRVEGNKVYYDCYLIEDGQKVEMYKYEATIEGGKIQANMLVKKID